MTTDLMRRSVVAGLAASPFAAGAAWAADDAKDAKKVYTEQSDPQKKAQYADEGKKKEEEE